MKANLIFSGGPDSTASALWALKEGYDVTLVSFQFKNEQQYGELFSASLVARKLNLPHIVIDFKSPLHVFDGNVHILMHAGTSTDNKKRGEPHLLPFGAGMILTYVSSLSLYNNVNTIIWGATKSDSYKSSEYTQNFADQIAELINKTTKKKLRIIVPFADKHKPDVLKTFIGKEELFSMTWSCKNISHNAHQCGTCKACTARRISSKMINLNDITLYKSPKFNNPFSAEELKSYKNLSDKKLSLLGSETEPYPGGGN
jgi:7-cyano-7-deazaguanine synthase